MKVLWDERGEKEEEEEYKEAKRDKKIIEKNSGGVRTRRGR